MCHMKHLACYQLLKKLSCFERKVMSKKRSVNLAVHEVGGRLTKNCLKEKWAVIKREIIDQSLYPMD